MVATLVIIYELQKDERLWTIKYILPMHWSHINHRSGVDQRKSASKRPMSQPLSHATNLAPRQFDPNQYGPKLYSAQDKLDMDVMFVTVSQGLIILEFGYILCWRCLTVQG